MSLGTNFRDDGDLPESVEDSTPEVFAEPNEAATESEVDGDLYVDRLLKGAVDE